MIAHLRFLYYFPLITGSLAQRLHNTNTYKLSTHSVQNPNARYSPRQAPDPNANQLFNINPEWSPDPNNHAPISLDPISPWNDNGRSQTVNNFSSAPWVNCPSRSLNCNRCPTDFRCSLSRSSTSTRDHGQQTPQPQGVDEYNAITGPEDSDLPTAAGRASSPCPLQRCTIEGARSCGQGAICKRGLCACPPGRKMQPGSKGSMGLRGWTWHEALNVYVDPSVPCEMPCDTVFCGEVTMAWGCAGPHSEDPRYVNERKPIVVAAQETFPKSVPPSQEIVLEAPGLDSPDVTATTQRESITSGRVVPTRSLASFVSVVLTGSTKQRALPTRNIAHEDTSLPVVPGEMGAIQVPRVPGEGAVDSPIQPEARAEDNADYVGEVAGPENVGENN